MITYGKTRAEYDALMLAYMDAVFAVPQLIAGVLVGVYFTKKMGYSKNSIILTRMFISVLYYSIIC